MKKILPKLLLVLIIILGFLARWYKIDNPIADWHSWRQVDTASVAKYYSKHGINLLYPKYQDISAAPSGKPNLEGYRMVEFPIYNAAHAVLAKVFTFWNFDKWGRVLAVFISLTSIISLYLIVQMLSGTYTALIAALLMALLPFNVFYSRVILPEPLMIAAVLAANYFFLRFFKSPNKRDFLLSALFLSLSLLVKPYAIFFCLPIFVLSYFKYRSKLFFSPPTYLYLFLAFTPILLWRYWIRQFPEGIPASNWLYNFDNIRFSFAWFRWLFVERYGKLILGSWGLIPLVLGLLTPPKKQEHWFYHLWAVGVLAYLVIFAGGNVRHDYYQAITIPIIIALIAKGTSILTTPKQYLLWPISGFIAIFALALGVGYSWYEIRGYYQINNPIIIEVGQYADKVLPKDAKVVAPYNGDTAFLYQVNRQGFPQVITNIEDLIKQGATHYVSHTPNDYWGHRLANDPTYQVLEETDKLIIIKLVK